MAKIIISTIIFYGGKENRNFWKWRGVTIFMLSNSGGGYLFLILLQFLFLLFTSSGIFNDGNLFKFSWTQIKCIPFHSVFKTIGNYHHLVKEKMKMSGVEYYSNGFKRCITHYISKRLGKICLYLNFQFRWVIMKLIFLWCNICPIPADRRKNIDHNLSF